MQTRQDIRRTIPKRTPARILQCACTAGVVLLLLCGICAAPVAAADVPLTPLPDVKHVTLALQNGGTKYLKFDGGGLNSLHITTSTAEPYGQVTMTETTTGTFYASDTGSRGFDDDIVLMVAVKNRADGTLPDDLRITVGAGGYQWEPMPELNQPPGMGDITYVAESAAVTLTAGDFTYGPQSWKPAGDNDPFNYPIYYGQNVAAGEDFSLLFVDLHAGTIGLNSGLSGLIDAGMVRIDTSVEGCDTLVSFSVYGWCKQSNQGEGISWTNRLSGAGSSGYAVAGSGGGGGGDAPAGSGSTGGGNSGDSSDAVPASSYIPPSAPADWDSSFGALNVTSSPGGAAIFIDEVAVGGTTNMTIETLPSGLYIVRVEREGYETPDDAVVTIRDNATKSLHFTLIPKEGVIYVYSDPTGAEVWVDGVKTPVRTNGVVHIPCGNHTVRMNYGEFLAVERNVTVSDAEPATVFVSFTEGGTSLTWMQGTHLPTKHRLPRHLLSPGLPPGLPGRSRAATGAMLPFLAECGHGCSDSSGPMHLRAPRTPPG
ncbi:PEGA domain-containing protein [Methanovulcanius yangii]|uniref:PEGA domain-containing protein n=1 Tax=Methanovulcanius yangii TaxID=1789227 RepID=UPI0029CA513D|nr:PEGA domain-containing protein [Methanovulcanius yangii]